jgi:hypothetical protein
MASWMGGHPEMLMTGLSLTSSEIATASVGLGLAWDDRRRMLHGFLEHLQIADARDGGIAFVSGGDRAVDYHDANPLTSRNARRRASAALTGNISGKADAALLLQARLEAIQAAMQ